MIDVGWWHQLALSQLPSGKLQTKKEVPLNEIIVDEKTRFALIDNRDIGKFVAKIITDPRALNKMVFCYNNILTSSQPGICLGKFLAKRYPESI
jgi:hypothetical protein